MTVVSVKVLRRTQCTVSVTTVSVTVESVKAVPVRIVSNCR